MHSAYWEFYLSSVSIGLTLKKKNNNKKTNKKTRKLYSTHTKTFMGCGFTIYSLFMDIQNAFLDIHNSFLDIQKWI